VSRNDILQTIEALRSSEFLMGDGDAELLAYRDAALCDIFSRITDRPHDDPTDILYWFMVEMEGYMAIQNNKRINMFDVALETADTILAMCEYPTES